MSRMIDAIRLKEQGLASDWRRSMTLEDTRCYLNHCAHIIAAPVFVLDNVAEYFFRNLETGNATAIVKEWGDGMGFPCIAPPFVTCWLEYMIPPRVLTNELTSRKENPERWISTGIEDVKLRSVMPKANGVLCEAEDYFNRQPHYKYQDVYALYDPATTRWLMRIAFFQQAQEGFCGGPVMSWLIGISPEGKIVTAKDGKFLFVTNEYLPTYQRARVAMDDAQLLWVDVLPILLGLSFLHCKNVQRVRVEGSVKLNKARLRRGKKPLATYYTLEIDPMKKVLREEGQIATQGLKRALHITRGHFADYTAGKGLFGKVHGTFWVPQHVKGSASHGIVEKDYAVKAPQEEKR